MSIPSGLQPFLTLTPQVPLTPQACDPPVTSCLTPGQGTEVVIVQAGLSWQAAQGRRVGLLGRFQGISKRVWIWFLPQGKEVTTLLSLMRASGNVEKLGQGMRNRPVGSWRIIICTRWAGPTNLEADRGEDQGGQNRWCARRSCSSSCCLTSVGAQATPRLWPCRSQVSPTPIPAEQGTSTSSHPQAWKTGLPGSI